MSASALTFDLRVFVGDVETSVRVKSDLNFAIFKRFKEEKFLDAPAPNATKVEIVRFENLGSSQQHIEDFSAARQSAACRDDDTRSFTGSRRGSAMRLFRPILSPMFLPKRPTEMRE